MQKLTQFGPQLSHAGANFRLRQPRFREVALAAAVPRGKLEWASVELWLNSLGKMIF
jgi:hypothetical protein